jgi:hypothetical protein
MFRQCDPTTIICLVNDEHEPDTDSFVDADGFVVDEFFEDDEPAVHPPWRRRVMLVAGLLALAGMLAFPLWNLIGGLSPPVTDEGLEICGWDYCIIQDAVREAGHDLTMSRLTHTLLDREQAQAFADELVAVLGVDPVSVEVVDRIEGRIAGQYHPTSRVIRLQRPARAWIVLHEVAHTVAGGHGPEFQAVVIDLAAHAATSDP